MSILYVGQLEVPNSTCRHRMLALQRLGLEVKGFDTDEYYLWGGRILAALIYRLKWGPSVSGFNQAIFDTADRLKPKVLWIDKGVWVRPRTLARIKAEWGTFLVHYTPDPGLTYHRSRHFVASLPYYDLVITTKPYEYAAYLQAGARHVLLQAPGFDPETHKPEAPNEVERKRFGADVAFVGHYEPYREELLYELLKLDLNLAIWGSGWEEHCADQNLRRAIRGGFLAGRDYRLAWSCAKIGVCILSRLAPDKSTTRTFEIPATGTFMLAERTDEHEALFTEGEEAEFFGDALEFREKVTHYLSHSTERDRIAAAGLARCLNGYTYLHRMREAWATIENLRSPKKPK